MTTNKEEIPEIRFKTTSQIVKQTSPRTFTFTLSTADVDRDRDVIDQDGIDIAAYRKNPVVMWAHDSNTPPVARMKSIFWRRGALMGAAEFPEKGTFPLADTLHDLIAGGFLRAMSIGFLPVEWSYDQDRGGFNFLKTELMEVSLVPVPSNRDCLMQAASKGIATKVMKDWAREVLELMKDEDPAPVAEPQIETEPPSSAAEPTGQDLPIEVRQEPEETSAGEETPIEEPCQSYDEAAIQVRAAARKAITAEVKRFLNYWSGRLED